MKRRRETIIELTPLLDVIMIILFMVLSSSANAAAEEKAAAEHRQKEAEQLIQSITDEADRKQSELEAALDESGERLSQAQAQLSAYEAFDEYSVIISVSITCSPDGTRRLSVVSDGMTESITYDWSNIRYGENSLAHSLEGYISEKEAPVFVSFTYSRDSIYNRDYDMITSVIDKLQSEHSGVYIKYTERND